MSGQRLNRPGRDSEKAKYRSYWEMDTVRLADVQTLLQLIKRANANKGPEYLEGK